MFTVFGMDITMFLTLIGVLMIIVTLIRFLGKLSDVGGSLVKWLLIGLLCLVLVWALYNKIGVETGWWTPISLDKWLKPLTDALEGFYNAIKNVVQRFIDWLFHLR